jgi:hypothetical protein
MKKLYTLAIFSLSLMQLHAAEIFVRVNSNSIYMATAFNQTQSNTTNIFRFFELPGGSTLLQIKDQNTGYFIFNQYVNVPSVNRLVAEIDMYGNLTVIQNTPVQSTNWYTPCGSNTVYNPPAGYPGTYVPAGSSSDPAFQQFLQMLDKESFDSNRLQTSKNYASKSNLSAQQIADIGRKFTFDSNRLEWAKYAYARCFDKGNYFLLKNTFQFSSSYSDLEDYISEQ